MYWLVGRGNYLLDARSKIAYCEIEIHPRDRKRTAFTSHHGLFIFSIALFGLHNTLVTFEKGMDVITSSVK